MLGRDLICCHKSCASLTITNGSGQAEGMYLVCGTAVCFRLKRLDFQWQEEEQDMLEAAAALAAELSNREKQKKIQKLQLQASESQVSKGQCVVAVYS